MRSREEVAELIMKVFDRLEGEFSDAQVVDAVLIVEVDEPSMRVELEDGREVPETVVLLESTSDRLVVQGGILEFARRTMFRGGVEEEDDDE